MFAKVPIKTYLVFGPKATLETDCASPICPSVLAGWGKPIDVVTTIVIISNSGTELKSIFGSLLFIKSGVVYPIIALICLMTCLSDN